MADSMLFDLMGDEDDFDFSIPVNAAPNASQGNVQSTAHTASFSDGAKNIQDGVYPMTQDVDPVDLFSVPFYGQLPSFQQPAFTSKQDRVHSAQWMRQSSTTHHELEPYSSWTGSPVGLSGPELLTANSNCRRPRRQNHACDQCRSAKRACNFRNDITIQQQRPLIRCTTCISRGLECTAVWLETKKASMHVSKRSPPKAPTGDSPFELRNEINTERTDEISLMIPTSDIQLVQYFSAREACIHHFNLYVDVVDMPLSHFLLPGTMPRRYSMGLSALKSLGRKDSFRSFSHQALEWVNACFDAVPEARASLPVAPHIFHTVSTLDAIFDRQEQVAYTATHSRDESINKAFNWAALAAAAQFSWGSGKDQSHCRDFARATWQRAKQAIFDNAAATGSFRLALAFQLFGFVEPPSPSEQTPDPVETSTYAIYEGIGRLQKLCRQARFCLNGHQDLKGRRCFWNKAQDIPPHNLPSEVQENLLELIAAVEWLFGFAHAAKTVMSRGKIQPLGDEFDQSSAGFWPKKHETTRILALELPLQHAQQEADRDESSPAETTSPDTGDETVTTLWRDGATPSSMAAKLKQCGILAIFQWSALARLTTAAENISSPSCDLGEIQQLCVTINAINRLYRTTFGVLNDASAVHFVQAPSETRRMAALISNDSELGILLYFDIIKRLQNRLAKQQPSSFSSGKDELKHELQTTLDFCAEQRLISATQISTFARSRLVGASPGIRGADGLKARIGDLVSHPVSPSLPPIHNAQSRAPRPGGPPLITAPSSTLPWSYKQTS